MGFRLWVQGSGLGLGGFGPWGFFLSFESLFLPARREDGADTFHPAGAAADQVFQAGRALLEQTLVLERFTEDDVEHRPMSRVREVHHAAAPFVDEGAE